VNADVSRDAFTKALQTAFDMEADDARELGEVVLSQFEETEEVDDETLDADLRSVFYTLEAKRMLSFRREERVTEEGSNRRAFFWRLRPEAFESGRREIPVQTGDDVYAELPASAWRHAA
jgi:hypothetical protein